LSVIERIYMSVLQFRSIDFADRPALQDFILSFWHSDQMVCLGKVFYPAQLPGFIAQDNDGIQGFVGYTIEQDTLQVYLIDSRRREQGLGTQLLDLCVAEARREHCRSLRLVITNDNLRAMRFFQKRGFSLHTLHLHSMAVARKIKPAIPERGQEGIPISHEIILERLL